MKRNVLSVCVMMSCCAAIVCMVCSLSTAQEPSTTVKKISIKQFDETDDVDILTSEEEELFKDFDATMEEEIDALFEKAFEDETKTPAQETPLLLEEEVSDDVIEGDTSLITDSIDELLSE